MAEISFRELIDPRRLQHLQNEFCKVTGVAAVCLDSENQVVTEPYVDKTWKRLDGEDPISTEYHRKAAQALDRVQAGSLEEQVVEELPDGGHVAAVAVSVENNTILYWQVYDLKKIDTISFYQILDLLRDTSVDIYRDRMSCFSAEAESRRSRSAEEEMSRNLHTIEATTEIVQLLDSDEQIELAMNKWLKILSEHIRVDTADIFQLHSDTDTMNVVCEWRAPGQISYFDKINGVEVYSFLHAEKPLVVSTDSLGNAGSKEIEEIGMKAVMIFPILKQESGNMVLSLNHRTQGHVWSMAEIKFTADAVKILQSILTRRIQKNSLAGSYAALEEILDNVGCAIYVTDQTTGRMLFANQILKNTFAKELLDHNFDALLQSSVRKEKTKSVSVVYHAEKETWYDLLCKEIAWVDGKKANLYSLYDITDKKLYQRRIEQQVKQMQKKLEEQMAAEGKKYNTNPGGYIWPVDSRYITSTVGGRNSPGGVGSTNHKGTDIGRVGYTSPVYAAKAGTVIISAYNKYRGNYVVVSHGSGNTTTYQHLSSRSVSVGTYVAQGQVVGITGTTGVSSGPHLHFEITENGQIINPLKYLTDYIKGW